MKTINTLSVIIILLSFVVVCFSLTTFGSLLLGGLTVNVVSFSFSVMPFAFFTGLLSRAIIESK